MAAAPDHLSPEAVAEWSRITADPVVMAELGLQTEADAAIYCQAWARMAAAERHVNEHGVVVPAPRTGQPIVNPHLGIAEAAAKVVQQVTGKRPHNGPAKGAGWGGPAGGGPAKGGGNAPAQPFTAASPTRVTDAAALNTDPDEIAYRKAQIATKRDERRIKAERTAKIEDMLFDIAMGSPIDAAEPVAKPSVSVAEQITAGTRLHAIYNGQPVSNVNMKAHVRRSIDELTEDELVALAGDGFSADGTDPQDGSEE